jgi:mono/diheme cytochrome c family protein
MLRKLLFAAIAGAIVGVGVFWFVTIPETVPASALGNHTPDLANGREMFYAGGCTSCHATPGQDDKTRLGGGLALKSPFGRFYVPNISSDSNDGVGKWSEADFVTAMTKGTSPNGRHYFPAFPYTSYQRMRIDDVRDLFAHLKTLPAVQGRVRGHDVPFPFNVRRMLGGWKALFLSGRPFEPDSSKSPQWNRGAYLVNGPGHCAECHSPRNALGGIVNAQRFAGGPNPEGEGWIPNITQQALADYSAEDIAYLLETGSTPDGDTVGGAMKPVIRNTSQLTPEDRAAMAIYIKSLAPVEGPKKPAKK